VITEYIQIFTTTDKEEDAEKIAQILIEKKLAGCVQVVGPVSSRYWWKDNVEKAKEWLCIIKSKKNFYEELEKTILEIHPYEVPEILAIPVIAGNKDYLRWLDSELKN